MVLKLACAECWCPARSKCARHPQVVYNNVFNKATYQVKRSSSVGCIVVSIYPTQSKRAFANDVIPRYCI
ncbi:hypothetical protein PPTG_23710 [Phytophthora nicotianae INRA-310]|uniref:Uncharacterized protein n=1 Tax=Phytophthora nicotianae (strain INRA-310) TaxID=761204 RepID=W2PV18_PHYN3|nr:hypothetical protein PPTG_23710 [Phytophthora nicotianae INRA-310]ETN03870.1 hypothetical protein PPTG_23710 [Phytophthora nicotianae INRA-310]